MIENCVHYDDVIRFEYLIIQLKSERDRDAVHGGQGKSTGFS